ncbi:type III-A CRISPR-associated RAMP protein Csm5 [Oribacterium parvum]|uniref:type III-A CRISPR-associated RAMP protein Csm5 n=1 Tax=Oribacterium parvum TaxID=1501329 RepID=UPI0028DAFC0A|nr:type III-A CRISPR-associated RAMP protein Csm5 [Oribacterium parvum]
MNPKIEENKMTPYLKRYRMKITALGPIHVGDGKKLKKIEYIYDKQNNRVYVLDATKTYSYLEQEGKLGRFQEYILSPEKGHKDEDNSKDIFSFLQKENISKEIWESWKSYDYDITEREDTSLKEIHSFVKDANGRPYVPGSSIKGMIRTALLAYLLGNKIEGSDEEGMFLYRKIDKQQIQYTLSKAKKESIAVGKRDLRKESVELEALVFHQLELRNGIRMENQRNAVCSILRGLLVRDSQPLSLKDLDLAQKVDLFSENSRRDSSISRYNNEETNSISMFREVLRPGTEIYFDLILDSKVFPYSLDTILAALDYFNEQCYYYHYKHFQRPILEKGIVWLGGGAGYCTKTASYPLLQEEGLDFVSAILAKNFRNHHDRDKELGVSPRTTPIFPQSNHTYDQGMGKIELVES